ncbi:MAG: indolepyruvate oxidoreductase subunit beta [Bacillota bacterium]
MAKTDILIAGVGGQGTILAGRIIAAVAMAEGLDVKMAETHGMAQRGGSVVTHARLAEKVYAPLIPYGDADLILAFERLEALRWLPFLSPTGTVIVNTQILEPLPVLTGQYVYPPDILDELAVKANRVIAVDALNLEPVRTNPRALNTLLLGIAARLLPFEQTRWEQTLTELLPPKLLEINRRAFTAGWSYQPVDK